MISPFSQVFRVRLEAVAMVHPQLELIDWMWKVSLKTFSNWNRCSGTSPIWTSPKSWVLCPLNIWRSHACPCADWLFKLTTTNEKTINNNDLMLEAIMVQFCRRKLITKKETLDSHRPTWYRASKNVARNRLNHMQYLLVNKNKRRHLQPQGLPNPLKPTLLPASRLQSASLLVRINFFGRV